MFKIDPRSALGPRIDRGPMRPTVVTLLPALLLLVLIGVLLFVPNAAASDHVVRSNESWREETRTVDGDLVIASGATLELSGSHLALDGRVVVEEGARLVLGPAGDVPTVLRAASDQSRFWIQVEGELVSGGTPATRIEQVWGRGLDTAIDLVGGIVVNGTARLHDAAIGPGKGPLATGSAGSLELVNASLRDMGFMGITSIGGNVLVSDALVTGHEISISGKAGCGMRIERSTIEADVGALQMIGCVTRIDDTVIQGEKVGLVLNGRAPVYVNSTLFHGYERTGIQADGAGMIHVQKSTFRPAEGRGERAIELAPGNHLIITGADISSHARGGIEARSSIVDVSHTRFAHQESAAVNLTFGRLELGDGLVFEKGVPVSQWHLTNVRLLEGSKPIDGLDIAIYDADGQLVAGHQDISGTAAVYFDRYTTIDGMPVDRGPFSYEASHPLGVLEARGPFEPDGRSFDLHVAPHDHGDEGGMDLLELGLAAAGVGLLAVALLVRRK